ncbi:PLP-dependent aminotransferase family protein [Pseudomonas entomophila]|uniref:aminotransferase-like domain-containing protein n=1 Tax=Pseudomonas entomophila TaxID=312306 RepID=UPI0023D84B3A|nr:PLP-dependent aminotransferase family protein [Pseudomonas entomophila]MDF0729533.1 PLP-dependent aminotransferase family protein [Pseudomonas entomophila]
MGRSARGEFAYQAVYRYLETLIAQAGQGGARRLPSLRDLSRRLRVSLATVQNAYSLLEHEGRVTSMPRSGYFVRLCPHDVEPITHAASSPFSLPPLVLPALERMLLAHERRLARQAMRLPASNRAPGSASLRQVLAARHTRSSSQCWNADDVHLACDVQALLHTLVGALALQGATALVATPCCWRLLQGLRQADVRVLEVPLDGYLDLNVLEWLLLHEPVRLLLLPSCLASPTGRLLAVHEQRKIEHLLDQHAVWLLENDLDSEHCFAAPPSARLRDGVDPRRLLVLGSLESVVGVEAPYAYLLGRQPSVREAFVRRAFVLPPLRQQAVALLLGRGDVDSQLQALRDMLATRMGQLCREVERRLGDHLIFQRPVGGRALWCRVRHPVDVRQVAVALAGSELAVAPGDLFSLHGHYHQHLLLAWGGDEPAQLQRAIEQLGQVLQRQLTATTQG